MLFQILIEIKIINNVIHIDVYAYMRVYIWKKKMYFYSNYSTSLYATEIRCHRRQWRFFCFRCNYAYVSIIFKVIFNTPYVGPEQCGRPCSNVCKGIHCNRSSKLSASLFFYQPTYEAGTRSAWRLQVPVSVCTHLRGWASYQNCHLKDYFD